MTTPSIPALAAGVSHLLHLYAAHPSTASWRRSALDGPAESGLAAALILAAGPAESGLAAALILAAEEATTATVRAHELQRALTAILAVLPQQDEAGSAHAKDARDACADLRDAVGRKDARQLAKLAAWMVHRPTAMAIVREVDGAD